VAVVTLKPQTTATEQELPAHAAAYLAAFIVSVAIEYWSELLPRNAKGKMLKTELRKLFVDNALVSPAF
jgi:long-chain acyl-CoA synthetase